MRHRIQGRKFVFTTLVLTTLALGLSGCGRVNFAPVFQGSAPSSQADRASRTAHNDGNQQVRVRRGDTLSEIALRNHVPTRDLARANGLRAPFTIFVGQELTIPGDPIHRVRAGESLSVIASRYDMTTRELARANHIRRNDTIYVGQELNLPWSAAASNSTRSRSTSTTTANNSTRDERPSLMDRLRGRNNVNSGSGPSSRPTTAPTIRSASPVPRPRTKPVANNRARASVQPASATDARNLIAPPQSGEGFMWPVDGVVLSSYGPKEGGQRNDGINIAVPSGTPVRAAEDGVVLYQGNQVPGYGNLVLIRHADGYVTTYAHNSRINVRQGQVVERGERIALSGRSGRVDVPQVHFEVRRNSNVIDPARILDGA